MKYCCRCMNAMEDNEEICSRCGMEQRVYVAPPHILSVGTVINGRYLIGGIIGEGGFGITYIGLDTLLKYRVAVKEFYPNGMVTRNNTVSTDVHTIKSESSQEFFYKARENFLREAQTLARFNEEPSIVSVKDFFDANNTVYIVMEYLEGITLKQHLYQLGGKMYWREAVSLLMPVLYALRKIHSEGLIHRDISPDNIMIVKGGIKLLDFGAAREYTDEKSLSVMLKHGYAPFEQYTRRGDQGAWTDIYAFCATLYKCITGETPLQATDRIVDDTLKMPMELGIEANRALDDALRRGLAVMVKDRIQNVDELIVGLQAALNDRGFAMPPQSYNDGEATVMMDSYISAENELSSKTVAADVSPFGQINHNVTERYTQPAPAPVKPQAPIQTNTPAPQSVKPQAPVQMAAPAPIPVKKKNTAVIAAAAGILLVGGGIFAVSALNTKKPEEPQPAAVTTVTTTVQTTTTAKRNIVTTAATTTKKETTTTTAAATTTTTAATTAKKKKTTKETTAEVKENNTPQLVNIGKKYNIYCWNTEFKERFERYYEPSRDNSLWNGVTVNWIINPNDGNNYQNKLDAAIMKQLDVADDEKIDLFMVEADYALKYVNSDVPLDVTGEIGLTNDDLSQQYQYTKDVMTDSNGILKGVSWQACPGLFLYNADYAKQVLGTDDPDKVQAMISDWNKFEEVAHKMKDAGIFMVSGYDDTYRCFSNNVSAPWVTNGRITIDPQIKAWVDQTKRYSEMGYNNGTYLWDSEWTAGQKIDGKVFGYFYSSWGIPFCLLPNTLDVGEDDGGRLEVGNGGYGKWRACLGPQSYYWGGTWIVGCYGSDNIAITRDIMLKLTCDADIMARITQNEQDYTNNKAAIKKLIDGGYTNPFLGGQNHLALLADSAERIDQRSKISVYDQGCNEEFQFAMSYYFTGEVDYNTALGFFKENILNKYSDLTMN